MKDVEILAPAGSIESLYSALNFGADAVYAGTSRFGARAFADNPSVEELQEALVYAHLRDKKIYLTVNTLLSDRELEEELYSMIAPLYEAGLDACIVQDMGVLSFLHDNFPDMDLHASTQMTLFSGEEANLLKKFGVTRYVPARELSIEEICEARGQTDLEIEVFVHGALCYCYSGQCLMSQVIGRRSGNRGMCAQPCRLNFDSPYGKGYFLSTKDSCTLLHIPELVEAGIDSFKIEGRMKRKEYSAYLACLYRKYTDIYREEGKDYFQKLKEDSDSILWKDYRRCQDLYNRGGFSDSFLFEKDKSQMLYVKKNNHFGTLVGEVVKAGKGTAEFLTSERLHYQDVLEFRDEQDNNCYEYTVKNGAEKKERVRTNVLRGSRIYPGQKVYRTRNENLYQWIQKKIEEEEKDYPLIGRFTGEEGKPSRLTVEGNGVSVTVCGEVLEKAGNRPVTPDDVRKKLDSLGNTRYEWEKLDVVMEPGLFLPLGSLKALRREGIAAWEQKAVNRRELTEKKNFVFSCEEESACNMISVSSLSQLKTVLSAAGEDTLFHLKLEDFPAEDWAAAVKEAAGRRLAISFPRILRGAGRKKFEKLWQQYGTVFSEEVLSAVVLNSYVMWLYAERLWKNVTWIADENLYQENRRAAQAFRSYGIQSSCKRMYGRIPVMFSESCVARTLSLCGQGQRNIPITTPKGDKFVVVNHCQYCYNTVYAWNPVREYGDSKRRRLDFTWEQEDEIRKVIQKWNF